MPAQTTYTPIATGVITVSNTNQITFTTIPQNFTDLLLVCSFRSTAAVTIDNLFLFTSNVTLGNFSSTFLSGDGASATSTRIVNDFYGSQCGFIPGGNATAGVFGSSVTNIMNYSNTLVNRNALTRSVSDLNGSGRTTVAASLLRGTGAITQITAFNYGNAGNLAVGSTATLYGIAAA